MTKYTQTGLLILVLFLGVCYGQEKATTALLDSELARFRVTSESLATVATSRLAAVDSLRVVVRQAERIAQAAAVRRGRVVASSDAVLQKVDTVVLAASSDSLAPLVLSLRSALIAERSASSDAISSLQETVQAQARQIAAMDSLIVVRSQQLQTLQAALDLASRKAPWYRQAVSGATKVLIGVGIGAILVSR